MDSCVGGSRACADCKYRARGDIDSVGLLLVITVDGFQWTSLFRIVRASFRGVACFGKRPLAVVIVHNNSLDCLGWSLEAVSMRTQSRFGQVCVAPNTCDSYRDQLAASVASGRDR
jgi:hypothetical protein